MSDNSVSVGDDDLAREIAAMRGHDNRMDAVAAAAAGWGAERADALAAAVMDYAHARLADDTRTAEVWCDCGYYEADVSGGGYASEDTAAAERAAAAVEDAGAAVVTTESRAM